MLDKSTVTDPIDADIVSLVDVLNRKNMRTVGSCCGHGTSSAYVLMWVTGWTPLRKLLVAVRSAQCMFREEQGGTVNIDVILGTDVEVQGCYGSYGPSCLGVHISVNGGLLGDPPAWKSFSTRRILSSIAKEFEVAFELPGLEG